MLEAIFKNTAIPTTLPEIHDGLLAQGWRLNSSNSHGNTSIYTHRKPVDGIGLIRVNTMPDFGFYNYAQVAMHFPSPHYQKIQWHGFVGDGENIHVTLTERLHPVPLVSKASEPLQSQLRAFWNVVNYIFPTVDESGKKIRYEDTPTSNPGASPYDEATYYSVMAKLEAQAPTLSYAVTQLLSAKLWLAEKDTRFVYPTLDMTPSNTMLRKEGNAETMVIADPIDFDAGEDIGPWQPTPFYQPLVNTIPRADQALIDVLRLPSP